MSNSRSPMTTPAFVLAMAALVVGFVLALLAPSVESVSQAVIGGFIMLASYPLGRTMTRYFPATPAHRTPAAPGWYPNPHLVNAQQYWDGNEWAGEPAPLPGPGVKARTIAFGVVWGLLAFSVLIYWLGTR